ncbi:hypothetical protein KGQ71_04260, partial [Patescibacteria group bacterium]|nr:hypothetical protein [Patescibacteria group bacterium]
IKGFDPRIGVIPSLRQLGQQVGEGTLKAELDMLEYQINWGAMTLHDAIKLAKLLIDTTAAMQSFSIGTGFGPDAPGVGGPVDIAVILPEEKGFRWQQSKALSLTAAEEVIQ